MKKEKKMRKTYYPKESTIKTISKLSEIESRTGSTIIDLAVEMYAKRIEKEVCLD